ncbi:MAG: MATE family efflux transporter [Oscillospiraceae bacterium]|nr:MATE family efflux transporter [Oscillospiraceae bacterium]
MKISLSDHFTYRKLLKFVAPSAVMMMFTSIYGVVDGLFVSNYVGKVPFAAINLVMPFIMILGGIGFMIGTGGSALVSKTLGEGDRKKANRYFTMMIYLSLICGAAASVIGFVFIRPISYLLGATDTMIGDCVEYGRMIFLFTTAFMMQNVFQSFLVTAEKPRLGLLATVGAGVTNMALDAWFIVGLGWGVKGAALATGISQTVGGILPLIYFLRPNSSLLKITRTKLEGRPVFLAVTNGSSELMSNISASVVSMIYNFQLMKFAGEDGVAAYGVLMYVQFVFIALFIGYAIGSAPIIGYHYGAINHSELKNMLKKSIIIMSISGVIMTLLAQALALPIAKVFVGYDEGLFDMTVHAFRVFSFSFILAGINIFASSFFTALNNGAVSAAISFLRTLIFQSTAVIVLPMIWELDGIWLSITVAEVFALIISVTFLAAKRKKYNY